MTLTLIQINEQDMDLSKMTDLSLPLSLDIKESDTAHGLIQLHQSEIQMFLGQTYDLFFGTYDRSETESFLITAKFQDALIGDFSYQNLESNVVISWTFSLSKTDQKTVDMTPVLSEFFSTFETVYKDDFFKSPFWGKHNYEKGWLLVEQGWLNDQFINIPGLVCVYDGDQYTLLPYTLENDVLKIDCEQVLSDTQNFIVTPDLNMIYNITLDHDRLVLVYNPVTSDIIKSEYPRYSIKGDFVLDQNQLTGKLIKQSQTK